MIAFELFVMPETVRWARGEGKDEESRREEDDVKRGYKVEMHR